MKPEEIDMCRALGRCTFPPASGPKRFARDMSALAESQPARELTVRQRQYLLRLAHMYRRQIGRCMAHGEDVTCARGKEPVLVTVTP